MVVDTGIHALGWTRQEAVNYMFEHTAMSKIDVEVTKLNSLLELTIFEYIEASKDEWVNSVKYKGV